MSDLKDSSLASQQQPSASAPSPAPATKPKPLSLYSLTSFAVLCAFAYLAYDAFLPPGSSHGTGFGLLSASSPSSHRAAESPSANAPYLPSSSSSDALTANIAGPSCRLLPNAHSDRFYTSVCCDLRPREADDHAPGATLWLVRGPTLGQGAEDLRIKAHGVAEPDRTGRPMASSKLDRPELQADGLSASARALTLLCRMKHLLTLSTRISFAHQPTATTLRSRRRPRRTPRWRRSSRRRSTSGSRRRTRSFVLLPPPSLSRALLTDPLPL